MRIGYTALLSLALVAEAGPREFGLSEYRAALAQRGIRSAPKLRVELNQDPPQHWRIELFRIAGGDLAGLMYGLLEAAEQIRSRGRLSQAKGEPFLAVRAVRVAIPGQMPLEMGLRWRSFFEMLARSRFNRIDVEMSETPEHEEILRILSREAAQFAVEVKPRKWRPKLPAALDEQALAPMQTVPLADLAQVRASVTKAKADGMAGIVIDALFPFEEHAVYYQTWGQSAYSPK